MQIASGSSAVTEQLAETLGHNLRGREVIELVSDLGGGKTTFVRGLARGLGSRDHVTSPTFKVSNTYQGKDLIIHHLDFYRLPEAGLMAHELQEVIDDPKAVVVIEWGEVVRDVLPTERFSVTIKRTGEETREITIHCPENLKYLLENL